MTLDDIIHCREFAKQLGLFCKGGCVFINNTICWTHEIAFINTADNFATIFNIILSVDGKPYFTPAGDRIYDISVFKSRLLENIKTYKQYLSRYRLNHINKDFI